MESDRKKEPHLSLGKHTPDSVGVFAGEEAVGVETRVLPCERQSLDMALLDRMNSAQMEGMNPEETEQ